jgi:hypothetical protein
MSLPKNHFFFFTSTRAMVTSSHLTEADALVQSVGDCLVEGFLDLDRPSLIEGELDDQPVRAALDDHYVIYLTQRPSKFSVTSDGRLLHDGPVFPGMMRLAAPGEHVRVGIFAHTQTVTVAVPGQVMRDSMRTLTNTPRRGVVSRIDLLSKPDLQVAQLGRMLRRHEAFDPAHEALFLHGITATLFAYLLRNHGRSVQEPARAARRQHRPAYHLGRMGGGAEHAHQRVPAALPFHGRLLALCLVHAEAR